MLLIRALPIWLAIGLSSGLNLPYVSGDALGYGDQQRLSTPQVQEDETIVPGNNPLNFCEKPTEYLLEVKKVDLNPNPPEA